MEGSKQHPNLSEREQQLITLASQGMTDTAIAHRLGISEPTVKSYWQRVRSKLGPYNRTELVAHALKEESEAVIEQLNGEVERLREAAKNRGGTLDLQREILESAPDAVFAVDSDGCFAWLNKEAERMFGYRFDELVGEPVSTLVPAKMRVAHVSHVAAYCDRPERRRMGEHLATAALHRDGTEFFIAASLAPIDTEEGFIVACFVRRVTEEESIKSLLDRYGARSQ